MPVAKSIRRRPSMSRICAFSADSANNDVAVATPRATAALRRASRVWVVEVGGVVVTMDYSLQKIQWHGARQSPRSLRPTEIPRDAGEDPVPCIERVRA